MSNLLAAIEKAMVKQRRKRVSRKLFHAFGGVVQNGPFKGLKLGGDANTSAGNLGAKIFGLYETEVLDKIQELGPFTDIVNFGAADGYFALGVLVGKLARRSICFELTEQGRASIGRSARNNGLIQQVEVRGAVDESVGDQLVELRISPTKTLILCDIEGAEFTIFTAKLLSQLAGASLIVELHDRLMPEGLRLREELIKRLPPEAVPKILVSRPKDWRGIESIESLEDNDRALVCSDGRKVLGEWLVVTYPSVVGDLN